MILNNGDRSSFPKEEVARRRSRKASDATGPRFEHAVRSAFEESLRTTRRSTAPTRSRIKPGTLQSKMEKLGIRRHGFC